ncbi:MAG: pantoate--beta-alanine ligase [Firmicutes bacterium]|nr:pantoate--beta-alanine ligase [Bacillota bacterium]
MIILRDISSVTAAISQARREGKTVGFVPTMGFLHQGHLSLVRQARMENDLVVLSIFVNPIQFGVGEDYEEYPRDLDSDSSKAEEAGCDLIFYPTTAEMYPQGYATFVDVERLTENLCGASRPGHFRGVTTVVTKLFNIVKPHRAYFGQKDAQQVLTIQRMVQDLNMAVAVKIMPTVREADGLALSSRNTYLSTAERAAAPILYRSLLAVVAKITNGERDANSLLTYLHDAISAEPLAQIDYISIVDTADIKPVSTIDGPTLIALAVRFGKTRLIDNIIVEV